MKRGYGQKGGQGPTAGLTSTTYVVTLPDGTQVKKRTFFNKGETAIATASRQQDGKVRAVVWEGEPAWEGDFGRLVARKAAP